MWVHPHKILRVVFNFNLAFDWLTCSAIWLVTKAAKCQLEPRPKFSVWRKSKKCNANLGNKSNGDTVLEKYFGQMMGVIGQGGRNALWFEMPIQRCQSPPCWAATFKFFVTLQSYEITSHLSNSDRSGGWICSHHLLVQFRRMWRYSNTSLSETLIERGAI